MDRDFALDAAPTPLKPHTNSVGLALLPGGGAGNFRHPDNFCCIVALTEDVPSCLSRTAIPFLGPKDPRLEVVKSFWSNLDLIAVNGFRQANVRFEEKTVLPSLPVGDFHPGGRE